MLQSRPDRQMLDATPEKEREGISEPQYELSNVLHTLKQNFPEVYRHVLGLAKAFLKDR